MVSNIPPYCLTCLHGVSCTLNPQARVRNLPPDMLTFAVSLRHKFLGLSEKTPLVDRVMTRHGRLLPYRLLSFDNLHGYSLTETHGRGLFHPLQGYNGIHLLSQSIYSPAE